MATILFKDGESIRVDALDVSRMIGCGWSPTDPDRPIVERVETQYPYAMKDVEDLPIEEAETKVLEAMGIKPKTTRKKRTSKKVK